jgi:hypothetical protein
MCDHCLGSSSQHNYITGISFIQVILTQTCFLDNLGNLANLYKLFLLIIDLHIFSGFDLSRINLP